jgi:two-component system, LuxR family, response regulator FixJ
MPDERKHTIFVIDDDASVRKALSRLLRSAGFQVETYLSAEQFMEREHFQGFGCILLDIQMPGLSGMILQQKLIQADYRLPIIIITGHGDVSTRTQAMQSGAIEFLTKPFDDQELLRAIEIAFQKESN